MRRPSLAKLHGAQDLCHSTGPSARLEIRPRLHLGRRPSALCDGLVHYEASRRFPLLYCELASSTSRTGIQLANSASTYVSLATPCPRLTLVSQEPIVPISPSASWGPRSCYPVQLGMAKNVKVQIGTRTPVITWSHASVTLTDYPFTRPPHNQPTPPPPLPPSPPVPLPCL